MTVFTYCDYNRSKNQLFHCLYYILYVYKKKEEIDNVVYYGVEDPIRYYIKKKISKPSYINFYVGQP